MSIVDMAKDLEINLFQTDATMFEACGKLYEAGNAPMIKKTYQVEKDNYQDAGKASSDIKKTLKALQIDRKILKAVAIASYEAEINIAIHSNGGTVTFEIDE